MPRPSTAPLRRQVGLTEDVFREVEDYRFEQRCDSESAALRELVELGLAAHKAGWKPRPARKRPG